MKKERAFAEKKLLLFNFFSQLCQYHFLILVLWVWMLKTSLTHLSLLTSKSTYVLFIPQIFIQHLLSAQDEAVSKPGKPLCLLGAHILVIQIAFPFHFFFLGAWPGHAFMLTAL